jgi:hypothetical protein
VGVALGIGRVPGRAPLTAAALLLGSLLGAYAATRLVALPPPTHREPVDLLGAAIKLVEADWAGARASPVHAPAGRASAPPALPEGAGP